MISLHADDVLLSPYTDKKQKQIPETDCDLDG